MFRKRVSLWTKLQASTLHAEMAGGLSEETESIIGGKAGPVAVERGLLDPPRHGSNEVRPHVTVLRIQSFATFKFRRVGIE